MPIIRQYPQVTTLFPTDAFVIDRDGVGTEYIEAQNLSGTGPYLIAFQFLGVPPGSSEILGGHIFAANVNFDINFSGNFFFHCDNNPTASVAIDIYQISGVVTSHIGVLTVNIDGTYSVAVPTTTSFAQTDSIKFIAPSATDATFANCWWTMIGLTS